MKYASTELILEHETILTSLRVLDIISNRLESGKDIPAEDIAAPVQFLKIFVDRFHHCKEECRQGERISFTNGRSNISESDKKG
ncbi:MAG: hypothetical protein CVV49_18055 [Spirochaetae bacterium HGW-Spirochaetae-5]|nr:MAG: hypothetical protein CVV49_18055 [Spirochaetae bacterium HGW-Spirochaetae-5]